MRELAYLNGLDDGTPGAPVPSIGAPVSTVIAAPVVRGRGRGRGVPVRGAHVVRSSMSHGIPRSAVVATVSTPRHASTAPETYVSIFLDEWDEATILAIDSHKFSRKMRESIEIEKHNT